MVIHFENTSEARRDKMDHSKHEGFVTSCCVGEGYLKESWLSSQMYYVWKLQNTLQRITYYISCSGVLSEA